MKNEDLFYAMNFLDEDLIAEADKNVAKAVVTPVKKKSFNKAKIVPLVASFAAAAAVLVIGGVILFSTNASAPSDGYKKSEGDRTMRVEDIGIAEGTADGDNSNNVDAGTANLDAGSYSTVTLPESVDGDDLEAVDIYEDETAPGLDINADQIMFEFEGDNYVLIEELDSQNVDDVAGDELGTIENSDTELLIGAEIYEYTGYEDRVIIYDYVTGQCFVALRLLA
jgi:hypothetical protein